MRSVTQTDRAAANRERVRRHRERQRAAAQAPLLYESQDWELFLRPETLPQKAGCEPGQLGRITLKELTDNANDAPGSGNVTIEPITDAAGNIIGYRIIDDGPGIDPVEVPKLFLVKRPMLSSKLKRLPLRGMLGNGLRVVCGAVAAYGGSLVVTSRSRRQELVIDKVTGETHVASNTLARPVAGTMVEIKLPIFDGSELEPAKLTLEVARTGTLYTGPSQPSWYGPDDLRFLFARVTPATTPVGHIIDDVFRLRLDDDRIAAELTADEVAQLHHLLRERSASRPVPSIGCIGDAGYRHYSGRINGTTRIGAADVPFCVEAWANCQRAERSDNTRSRVQLLLNRTPTVAQLSVEADSQGLWLNGCGLDYMHVGGKRANYALRLSLITPYVLLTNDGKSPLLDSFHEAVRRATNKATGSAYNAMVKPPKKMSIIEAAQLVMSESYLKASGRGLYPANARQIMYAARGEILRLTGRDKFGDAYFTQTLLPNYIEANPDECANWDVVYDGRGHFVEPHTNLPVLLSTIDVRDYLGERQPIRPAVTFNIDVMFPTNGPENRFRNVLFVEKEGFAPLLREAQIAEKFDIAVMSSKGMSVSAARRLIDKLIGRGVERVFVLHDFDVSGFSIHGTLGTDSRRYVFENDVEDKVIDLGLRLKDAQALDLQFEPVLLKKEGDEADGEDSLEAREATLRRHGATEEEIEFLLSDEHGKRDGRHGKRVELNSMTSDVFVAFLERKLTEAGVKKFIPTREVMHQQAQRLYEQTFAKAVLDKARPDILMQAAAAANKLPRDVVAKVRKLLAEQPVLPWDKAVAIVLKLGH